MNTRRLAWFGEPACGTHRDELFVVGNNPGLLQAVEYSFRIVIGIPDGIGQLGRLGTLNDCIDDDPEAAAQRRLAVLLVELRGAVPQVLGITRVRSKAEQIQLVRIH